MEFEINDSKWNIIEITNESMEKLFGRDEDEYIHGMTRYSENIIYINNSSPERERTLKHELMHVWLYVNGHNQCNKDFDNEDICEIVASSNNFINKIIKEYFEKGE